MLNEQPSAVISEKQLNHHFDVRWAVLLVMINATIVFWINLDGVGGASRSALLQMVLTFVVVGLFLPRIRRAAESHNKLHAYIYGGVTLPAIALSFTYVAHAYFQTPNLLGTAIFLIVSTFIANVLLVVLKRNYEWVPNERLQTFMLKL